MVFATRHIPATHVAMLMNLDVIIGPLLAVAAFGEYPTLLTVIVCIIVITVLICHTAVYESGFLDDRQAADLFRFPLFLTRGRGKASAVCQHSAGGCACRGQQYHQMLTCTFPVVVPSPPRTQLWSASPERTYDVV